MYFRIGGRVVSHCARHYAVGEPGVSIKAASPDPEPKAELGLGLGRTRFLRHINDSLHKVLRNVALDIYLNFCVMNPPQSRHEAIACHNCRRRRLKCDRSLPQCLKCIKRGQECLGYQRLFRWEQGVASRGKMAGITFEEITKARARHQNSSPQLPCPASLSRQPFSRRNIQFSPLGSLTDPLVQDVNHASRKYLFYCELPLPSCSVSDTNQRPFLYYSC